jgi:hypothetical protein
VVPPEVHCVGGTAGSAIIFSHGVASTRHAYPQAVEPFMQRPVYFLSDSLSKTTGFWHA